MKISVPRYLLESSVRHIETLMELSTIDRSDAKAANALRLLRGEVKRLQGLINNSKQCQKDISVKMKSATGTSARRKRDVRAV